MKLYRVNTAHLEDAVLTEEAFEQLMAMNGNTFNLICYEVIERPTDDDLCAALYWDHEEQAFMSGAFDGDGQ